MNAKLKPGIQGYLPLLVYFAFIIPMALLAVLIGGILLQIMFIGSALFVFMIFARELVTRLRLKIEIKDDEIILPAMTENVYWPVNVDENILPLPGFEFEEDVLVKVPYYNGKDRYIVPLDKLTGVWLHTGMNGAPVLSFGTEFYDVHYDARLFGQDAVEAFIETAIPAALLAKDNKFKSIVYQAHQENLAQLLKLKSPVSAVTKSGKGWILPVFFGLLFAFFLVSGIMTTNRQNLFVDSLFWLFWVAVCYVIFLRLYGEQEVIVDHKWVELRVRQQKFRIHWNEVTHFTLQGRLILWGENIRIVIPNELLHANKLLLNLLRVKHFEGELEARPILLDEFVWNKGGE
ncbi:MAG TPA: hypothetical protein VJ965_09080 [Anaerolineales bacterium]|nr:hypothetical protein [Anaerolineales bacterium]